MTLQIDRTIKAGDILTSITVLLSVVALMLSFAKDREARVTDQATKIRAAAATAIVRVDRWQAVQLSMYQDLQPTFWELSETLSRNQDSVTARDQLRRQVHIARAKVSRQVLDEQLSTAHAEVITHFPAARAKVMGALVDIANVEQRSTEVFLTQAERRIAELKGQQANHPAADLVKALKEASWQGALQLQQESDKILDPVRAYLFSLVEMNDADIISASSR